MVCQNRPQNNSFRNCHFVIAVYLLFMDFIFQERASSAILPLILLSLLIFMRVPVSCCCRNYRGGKKSCGRLPCRGPLRRCRGHIGYRNDFDPPVGNQVCGSFLDPCEDFEYCAFHVWQENQLIRKSRIVEWLSRRVGKCPAGD